jgi:hypothetical protein
MRVHKAVSRPKRCVSLPYFCSTKFLVCCVRVTYGDARNTFPIPEIIFDPSLILSPHVFLLGLIFADKAFAAPNLTTAEQLSGLDIRPGYEQLPLLLKPSMANVPVFCKSIKTLYG